MVEITINFRFYSTDKKFSVEVEDDMVEQWREDLVQTFGTTKSYFYIMKNGNVGVTTRGRYQNPVVQQIQTTLQQMANDKYPTDDVTPYLNTWLRYIFDTHKDEDRARALFKKTYATEISEIKERVRKRKEWMAQCPY